MSVSAGLAAAALSWSGLAQIPTPAALSVVAIGPVLDIAMAGRPQGWRLYVRFALAGCVANLLAFALKFASFKMGWDSGSGGNFASFRMIALVSFVLCGAVADPMLRTREQTCRVAEIVALVSADCGFAQHARELGCFAEAFVASAPTLVARHGDARRERPVDAGRSCFNCGDAGCFFN